MCNNNEESDKIFEHERIRHKDLIELKKIDEGSQPPSPVNRPPRPPKKLIETNEL